MAWRLTEPNSLVDFHKGLKYALAAAGRQRPCRRERQGAERLGEELDDADEEEVALEEAEGPRDGRARREAKLVEANLQREIDAERRASREQEERLLREVDDRCHAVRPE